MLTEQRPGPRQKIRIGELLVKNRIITEEQLISALAVQKSPAASLATP